MKRSLLFLLILALTIPVIIAQPKIAVLDASVGGGVNINASSIVADTINEQFVKSPDYTAIDRAYISNIQEEKKFQLSGEVNDADIKELGITFGADYLCIANVSLLGSTYTVSARLIRVETAEVVSQESARSVGTIDILFDVAEDVGRKLVGAQTAATRTAQTVPSQETAKPVVHPSVPAAGQPERQKLQPKSHATFSYMIPGYLEGQEDGYTTADVIANDYYYNTDLSSWGLDAHVMIPYRLFYGSAGFTFTTQEIYGENSYGDEYYWENFTTGEIYAGLGVIYPFTKNIQVYGGITLGYFLFTLGSDYDGNATMSFWADPYSGSEASGMSLGFELGADYTLGPLCLSLRYKFSRSGYLEGEYIFTQESESMGGDNSFGHHGLVLGAGLAW